MANNLHGKEQVEEILKVWGKLTKEVSNSINVLERYKKTADLPSDYVNKINAIKDAQNAWNKAATTAIQKQTAFTATLKEEKRLADALLRSKAQITAATSENARALAKNRFETQQLNKLNKEAGIISSKLATEYQKLEVRFNRASRTRQSLIAKQAQGIKLSKSEQRELRKSSKDYTFYQKSIEKADRSVGKFQRNVGNYKSAFGKASVALRSFVGIFGVFSAGIIARDIFQVTKELDALDKSLIAVTETSENFNRAQSFVTLLAEEAGVEIKSLQGAYVKFLASAKSTNLTIEETEDIFRQTAKAGAILGLSTDDINGSFRALEQILSKGKVQAEEIRGQLGERLPGAFQILAKSMGLTTAELSKQLELGNVISEEVLPNFARELEKTFSLDAVDRIDTLVGAQNRLSNAWTSFISSLNGSDGALTKIFTKTINFLSTILNKLAQLNTSEDQKMIDRTNKFLTEQSEIYETLGDRANAFAANDFTSRNTILQGLKKQRESLQKTIASYDGMNSILRLTRSEYTQSVSSLKDLNRDIAKQEGLVQAAKIQLGLATSEQVKNTEVLDESTNSTNVNNIAREKQISLLKEWEQSLKDTAKASETFDKLIGQDAIDELKDDLQAQIDNIDPIDAPIEWNPEFSPDEFKIIRDQFEELGQLYGIDADKFSALFDDKENTVGDYVAAVGEGIKGLYSLFENNYEQDLINAQQAADTALLFAGDNAAAQAEIREQLAEREKEIRQKQAKEEKAQAIFSIITNTAVAVVKALPNVPLSLIIGGIGLANLTKVLTTPLPQFEIGTMSAPKTSDAIVDEAGAEIHTDSKGNIKSLGQNKGARVTKVTKGDKIFTAEQSSKLKAMAFQNDLSNILNSNGILQESNIQPIVIKDGFDDHKIVKGLDDLKETIKRKKTVNLSFDKNGMNASIQNGLARTKLLNNRGSFKGSDV